MTNMQIQKRIQELGNKLQSIEDMRESTILELKQVRKSCPHRKVKTWTNNDGGGQFIVERCEVCGLQRDGGLSR